MKQYLRQRKNGAYFYQRRVPKDLRHRTDVFKSQFIEVYLGTSDRTAAKRKVSAVNESWERTFDAMRRDEMITVDQMERIRLAAQFQVHAAMMADPLNGPERVQDDLERFLPNVEEDAQRKLIAAGLDLSERNLNEAERAIFRGTMGAQALFEQGLTPPEPPGALMLDTAGPSSPTIMEAADMYAQSSDVAVAEKTRKQLKRTARLFADHVGHGTPVSAVAGKDAVAFLDRLAGIDPDYRRDPNAGGLTLEELEHYYSAVNGGGLSAATLNKHAGCMRVLVSWLIRRHELPEEHKNPFAGKSRSIKTNNGYLPMTATEIATLLNGATFGQEPGKNFKECVGWLVLLGAFTGSRAGELCALTREDIREKNGIPFMAVRAGKTESAERVVPLHPVLLDVGFVDYSQRCKDQLFGISEKTLAKRFPAYRRSRGVDRDGVVFHSLRKSFVSRLEEAEVPHDTAAMLVGHKSQRSFTYDVYSPHGPTLGQLAKAVNKVRYRALVLPMAKG